MPRVPEMPPKVWKNTPPSARVRYMMMLYGIIAVEGMPLKCYCICSASNEADMEKMRGAIVEEQGDNIAGMSRVVDQRMLVVFKELP